MTTRGRRLGLWDSDNPNSGHGNVHPRPDGLRAKCGSVVFCEQCKLERENAFGKQTGQEKDIELICKRALAWAGEYGFVDDEGASAVFDAVERLMPEVLKEWENLNDDQT